MPELETWGTVNRYILLDTLTPT